MHIKMLWSKSGSRTSQEQVWRIECLLSKRKRLRRESPLHQPSGPSGLSCTAPRSSRDMR